MRCLACAALIVTLPIALEPRQASADPAPEPAPLATATPPPTPPTTPSPPAPTPPAPPKRAPLREGFPLPEIIAIGALGVADVTLGAFSADLAAARGAPLFGDPPGFDRAASDALYQGPNADVFLAGAPELVASELEPALAVGYYGLDSIVLWARGRSLTGAANPDHHLFGFLEAYFLTEDVSLGVKIALGRERPFEGLHRFGSTPGDPKTTMAFWSNQTATSFCVASYLWRDFSDWLVNGPLAQSSPGSKIALGRVLPGVVFFGVASVDGLSRIIDQRHYLSDTLVGAAVGTAISQLVYAYHFDGLGQPIRRWAGAHDVSLSPVSAGAEEPVGVALRGTL